MAASSRPSVPAPDDQDAGGCFPRARRQQAYEGWAREATRVVNARHAVTRLDSDVRVRRRIVKSDAHWMGRYAMRRKEAFARAATSPPRGRSRAAEARGLRPPERARMPRAFEGGSRTQSG